jgi:hypothetical protein
MTIFPPAGVRKMVGSIVESVARTTVNLEVTITELDGELMLWMAPPPSNNLWVAFLQPPKLKLAARPLNTNSLVHYGAMVRSRSVRMLAVLYGAHGVASVVCASLEWAGMGRYLLRSCLRGVSVLRTLRPSSKRAGAGISGQ